MPKFDVHVYVVVRCKVVGVEAATTDDAIVTARNKVQNSRLWQNPDDFGDEFEGYLLDPYKDGEPDCDQSEFYADECHVENVLEGERRKTPKA